MEQLGFHWKDFDKIWYLRFFRKSVEKIQVSIKTDKKNLYFYLRQHFAKFFVERDMF